MHQEAAELICQIEVGELEVFPFTLINHKGRVHSRDYVFLNPLGTFDCLNMKLTQCKRYSSGKIMKITKFVLDRDKIAKAPDLFRPREDSGA